MKNKKIGIDCRLAGKQHAGIGRYIENLVKSLISQNSDVEYVLFFQSKVQADQILCKKKPNNVKVVIANIKHYTLAEQLKLPAIFNLEKLDLLHIPHFNIPIFYGGKIVVTIHDLLWHSQKGTKVTTLQSWKYWLKYIGYQVVVTSVMTKASKIIVPTKEVLKEIIANYDWLDKEIKVVKEGVDLSFLSGYKINLEKRKKSKEIVYVGSLYPHKNLQLVIKALKLLPDYKLHIVGARSVFLNQIEKLVQKEQVKKQVEFHGYLEDKKLIKLLNGAQALVQPSLSEGFGLTGIEAMATGCPVLASDIPIFKEVYGSNAQYFDPNSTASFIKTLENTKKYLTKKQIESAKKWSKQYDWTKMAQEIFNIYQSV